MQGVFRVAGAAVSIYMLLIFVRVLLTWFSGARYGRAYEVLASVTDPYLDWFRRTTPVRFGAFDFSPLVGILALGIVGNVFSRIAISGSITVGYLLAIVLSAVWSVVSFFLLFFLVVAAIRMVGLVANLDEQGRFWSVIEQILNPFLQVVVRPFLRGHFTSYRRSLLIFIAVIALVSFVGRVGIRYLTGALVSLPF